MKNTRVILLIAGMLLVSIGMQSNVQAASKRETIRNAGQTVEIFKRKDPSIRGFFKRSYAYAVFPTVGKAGIGIGGAYGKGAVFRGGKFVGIAKLTQVSVGFQLGGQAYREIIFFQTSSAYRKFTSGKLKLGAQISAVAVKEGAAAATKFNRGIAVFTMTKGGLMYEATVAGQSFKFSH